MFDLVKKWILIFLPLVLIWSFVILFYNNAIFSSNTYYLIDFKGTFDYMLTHKLINFDFVDMFTNWISDLSSIANNLKNITFDNSTNTSDLLNILYNILTFLINYIVVPLLYIVSLLGYVLNFFVQISNIILNFIYLCLNPIFYDSGIKKDLSNWVYNLFIAL